MKKLVFAAFLAVSLLVPAASASVLALDFTTYGPGVSNTGNYSLGWEFTVNSPITVDGLAFYDYNGTGDTGNHAVGIYDSSADLLVSATVTNATCPIGTAPWCVTSVTPDILSAGTYYIMSVVGTDDYDYLQSSSGLVTIPQITYVQDEYFFPSNGVLSFPNASDGKGTTAYFGPSFTVEGTSSLTPEPASFLLVGGGLLLAAGLRRRFHA